MGDRAVGRTTGPFRERLHLHQHRASLQSFKAIVVIQSVIVDTEIVTVAAARALIARVRCVTHRVFQQRGKMMKVDADVLSLSRLFGRRVASILVSASPAVTGEPCTGGRRGRRLRWYWVTGSRLVGIGK